MHQHPRMEPFIAKNNTNEPKKDFSRQVEVPIFDTKFNVTVEFDPDRTIDYKLLKVLVKKISQKFQKFKILEYWPIIDPVKGLGSNSTSWSIWISV